MEENGLSVADALALSKNGNGGLGDLGGGGWIIIILIIFLFGMGGRGFGNNGNSNGTNTVVIPTSSGPNWSYNSACCTPATAQGVTDAFNFNALQNGISSTHDSVIDGFYQNNLATTNLGTAIQSSFGQAALQNCQNFNGLTSAINNSTNTIQSSLCNGFNGIQSALANTNFNMANCCCETRESIMQSNFNNQSGFNTIGTAIATNACDIERGQDDIRYLMAQNQSQTMVGIDKLGDRLIDYMNQSKMDELRNELQNAKFQISQAAQTDLILNQLQPIAKPSYLVSSPYQSLAYNAANGCGCGNF